MSKRVVNYIVVKTDDFSGKSSVKFDLFVKQINAYISSGWQPIGGIAVDSGYDSPSRYVQSLVKYEDINGELSTNDNQKEQDFNPNAS